MIATINILSHFISPHFVLDSRNVILEEKNRVELVLMGNILVGGERF